MDQNALSLVTHFEESARAHADRTAVFTRGRATSYATLDRLADAVADAVTDRLGPGDAPVGVLLENGVPAFAALVGVLKAGRPFVPLDPALPRERGTFLLEDSTAAAIVTDAAGQSVCETWSARRLPIIAWEEAADRASTSPGEARFQHSDPPPESPAWILYTSGSTGRPKGVVQVRGNVVHYARTYREAHRLTPADRLSLVFSFGANFAQHQIFAALLSGAALHPFDIRREGFAAMAEWLAADRITALWCVPTAFRRLADACPAGVRFPHLRLVMLGGEPVRRSDWEAYTRLCEDDCMFISRFGASETGTVRWHFADKQTRLEGHTMPLGHAAPDNDVVLLDEEAREVPIGATGEIVARSTLLSPGYWRRPDLTASAYRPDPRGGDSRLFFTGDLGRMESGGCLVHLGRKDFQVKVRGYRVELGEVEQALLSLPGIREAVAMGRPDASGQTRLVAWLVAAGRTRPGIGSIRRHLADVLPEYMIPSAFVFLDQMPLATNGKVHRGALPDPSSMRPELDTPYAAPETPVEQVLVDIWTEVLGMTGIGVDDDFLELGGQSIQATRIQARVPSALGAELKLSEFFESRTVRRLAQLIGGGTPRQQPMPG